MSIGFFIIFNLSFWLMFIVKPSLFFWRAWEYYNIINRSQRYASHWKGNESGDLSRRFTAYYQQSWPTRVTYDEWGYRNSTPAANKFNIIAFGDSTIWGSGVSDHETLASRLSTELGQPVKNTSGGTFADALRHPQINQLKLVIHGLAEREIVKGEFPWLQPPKAPFRGIINKDDLRFINSHISNHQWWSPGSAMKRLPGESLSLR